MSTKKTELEKRNIVRLSNKQANLITKTCLQTALIELLDIKKIEDISVTELTKRAGVSRTAFYSNYQTVNDILYEFIDSHIKALNELIWTAINNKEDMFHTIINKMYEDQDLYQLVLKADLEKTAFFKMRDYIKVTYPNIDNETYYSIIGLIGLLRNIIIEWFLNGCNESVLFISDLCSDISKEIKEKILKSLDKQSLI